jgi:hypothetical protein
MVNPQRPTAVERSLGPPGIGGIDEADGMELIRIGKLDVAYRRAGSGRPLVILPGAMDDGQWWERQLHDLSAAFTVVV